MLSFFSPAGEGFKVLREMRGSKEMLSNKWSSFESKTAEADASSICKDDERLKRDEIRHSDEWPRWVCMGLV